MNIIQAIKSGKPFRRPCMDDYWVNVDNETGYPCLIDSYYNRELLTAKDILAEDWEVKEETRELTWADTLAGVSKHIQATPSEWDKVKKELGFDGD